jgi:hypothetical protein
MRTKLPKLISSAGAILVLLASISLAASAAPPMRPSVCEKDYTVRFGDSISNIADKYFGNVLAYPAIVEATNQAAKEDSRYTPITSVDVIEFGQVLCIPSREDAEEMLGGQFPSSQAVAASRVSSSSEEPPTNAEPATSGAPSTSGNIRFSRDSQVSRQPFQLTLTNLAEGTLHFTTNGALPNANSTPFQGPIDISQSTVIRVQAFDDAGTPIGDVHTKSYLVVNYNQSIPVISIVADWGDLDTLHANTNERGRDWERPINLEYFTPGGKVAFNVKAGIRIHGGVSRSFSRKYSYRIYFRKSYGGPGMLDYPLFEDSVVTKFDKLILRAGYNDAFTYQNEALQPTVESSGAVYIRDQVVRNLHRDMGQPIAHGSWVLLYLNGEFWGLYNLTERIDLQYLQSYYDPDSEWDVIAKEVGHDSQGNWINREGARDGNYGGWLDNQDWVGSADFSNPGNIGDLEWRVDMENVFSYMFLQAYVQNYDWPRNNWIVYQRTDAGAEGNERKWRMMIWDAEFGLGGGSQGFKTDINTVVNVYSPHDSITRILEKPFIHNCGMKHRFVNRAREYLGVENLENKPADQVGQLSKDRVRAEVLKQASIVRPFIQMEADRWVPGSGLGAAVWEQNISNVLRFVEEREDVVLHHLDELRYQTFTDCQ